LTAFLGYQHSPKWFNISNKGSVNYNKGENVRNFKVNSKRLFNKSIVKRGYSTSSPSNSLEMSERLETIIKELGLNLVYCYENLNVEATRKQILNDTRGLSGIYMIINKTTKDYYIGSASTGRFYARFCNHIIYFRGSKIVKLAIKKYDLKNFAFVVLELYPNIVTKDNNNELINLEDKYLKLFVPNYNILTEAGSSFGYKHTEIDRQKMKDIYSDARREQIGNLNKAPFIFFRRNFEYSKLLEKKFATSGWGCCAGKKLSPETIEKLTGREKALIRPPVSDETKKKCITKTRPVVLYNLDRTIYGKYPTIIEAAKAINCDEKTIRRALQTKKKFVKRQWIVEDTSSDK